MRPALVLVAIMLALPGCARTASQPTCPEGGRETPGAALVHVDTLNDANADGVVCYRVAGGVAHAAPIHAASSTPNVGPGEDLHADPGATVEAWLAGSEAIGRAPLPTANESWIAIVTGPGAPDIMVYDRPPAFD